VLKMRIEHEGINEVYDYEYNHLGAKTSFKHTLNGTLKNVSRYEFDELGRLKTKKLSPFLTLGTVASGSWNSTNTWQNNGLPSINDYIKINAGHNVTINYGEAGSAGSLFNAGTLNTYGSLKLGLLPPNTSGATELQSVDYSYNIRGLRGINLDASDNMTDKLFSMKLSYETAGFWDGNIGKQEWKSNIDNVTRSFTYGYDGGSRIKFGIYGSTKAGENYSLNNVTYDFNGNITNLSRNGWKSNNTFGLVDNLNYTYNSNSNKILKVDDASNETASFTDVSGNDYVYNSDGSLVSDANKGITLIEYNYLKLPHRIVQNGIEILNQYSSSGVKLKETIGSNTTDYLGNIIKKNEVIYQISHDEGRIIDGEYEYFINDHLGNLRVAFRDSSGVAKISQKQDYDPYGSELQKISYLKSTWKQSDFKYSGKEFIEQTGLNDFGWRLQDPILGRMWGVDYRAEKYYSQTPMQFALNNPLLVREVDGDTVTVIGSQDAQKQLLQVVNQGLGGYYTGSINHNGQLTISQTDKKGEMTKSQSSFAEALTDIRLVAC
jgi:RHS repeat-associated protein